MSLASLWRDLFDPYYLLNNPFLLLVAAFQVWMLVDALRRREWIWALCIFFFWGLSALLYFFMVYRQQGPAAGGIGVRGFELPGAKERSRIKELMGRIHHLDHARDHYELADVYFAQGKLEKAEASYRAALERDPEDLDIVAHLGQCLLRRNQPADARVLLEKVVAVDPRHDYGHTLMALAECQTELGQTDAALASWKQVLQHNAYARAKVQYAELLLTRGDREGARREFQEVLDDDAHSPAFQRKRERVWVRRAAAGLRSV